MSFGSAMQNIFGVKPAATPATQVAGDQKTPGNMPAVATSVPAVNNPTNPVEPGTPPSPIDQFKDMWQADPNAKAKTVEPLFANLDPASIAAAAKTNDFTKVITPELNQILQKGGPEATAAMMQVMNAMSQKSFGDSAVATTKIVEQALEKQQQRFLEALPSIIKNQNLSDTLRSTNPMFSNPAVKPVLDMMTSQVALKHPDLSAAEQAKMAQDYVVAFSQTMNPAVSASSRVSASEDWSSFFPE